MVWEQVSAQSFYKNRYETSSFFDGFPNQLNAVELKVRYFKG
jgi:hypothetical protein